MALEEMQFYFEEGDNLLCYYGNKLYEAKCVKRCMTDYGPEYFIHYKNWKKRWDEWVTAKHVIEVNDLNLKHMHRYNKRAEEKEKQKKCLSNSNEVNTASVTHKRKHRETVSMNNQLNDKTQIEPLKTKRGRPRNITIEDKKHCSSSEVRSHITGSDEDNAATVTHTRDFIETVSMNNQLNDKTQIEPLKKKRGRPRNITLEDKKHCSSSEARSHMTGSDEDNAASVTHKRDRVETVSMNNQLNDKTEIEPLKTKRGRPRNITIEDKKHCSSSEARSHITGSDEDNAASVTHKRDRVETVSMNNQLNDKTEIEPLKKKRGRPRNITLEDKKHCSSSEARSHITGSDEDNTAPVTHKRDRVETVSMNNQLNDKTQIEPLKTKRGRPRNITIEDKKHCSSSEARSHITDSDEDNTAPVTHKRDRVETVSMNNQLNDKTQIEPLKTKRGRPRNITIEDKKHCSSSEARSHITGSDEDNTAPVTHKRDRVETVSMNNQLNDKTEIEPLKKKRGRPRNITIEDKKHCSSSEARSHITGSDEDNTAPVTHKRDRVETVSMNNQLNDKTQIEPLKTKRGRPRKLTIEYKKHCSSSEVRSHITGSDEDNAASVTRKRDRVETVSMNNQLNDKTQIESLKTKRGRPRKLTIEDKKHCSSSEVRSHITGSDEDNAASVTRKRDRVETVSMNNQLNDKTQIEPLKTKRGRPRNITIEDKKHCSSSEARSHITGSDEDNTAPVTHKRDRVETVSMNNQLNDKTQIEPLKKKRGRPRKLTIEDKKHCSSSEVRSHITGSDEDNAATVTHTRDFIETVSMNNQLNDKTQIEPLKKKRGRPRNITLEDKKHCSCSEARSHITGFDEENTALVTHKRKRVESVSMNIQLNDKTQIEPLKKKRGRPRKLTCEDKNHCRSSEAQSNIVNNNINIPGNMHQSVEINPMKISTSELNSAEIFSEMPKNDIMEIEYSFTLKAVKMPHELKNVVFRDWVMVNFFHRMVPFNDDNSVSSLLNDYMDELGLSNANDWRRTYDYCLLVLNLVNLNLHSSCMYHNEKEYNISQQSMLYFLKNGKKTKKYFHNALFSKRPWVHVYSPIYLLRILGRGISISSFQKEKFPQDCKNQFFKGFTDSTFKIETLKLFDFIAKNHAKYMPWDDYVRIPGQVPDMNVLRGLLNTMKRKDINEFLKTYMEKEEASIEK